MFQSSDIISKDKNNYFLGKMHSIHLGISIKYSKI